MSELRLIRVAIWRELYSRRKAFTVSTALALTVVVGGLVVAGLAVDNTDTRTATVAVLDGDRLALEREMRFRLDPDTELEVIEVSDQTTAEARLRDGEIDAMVLEPRQVVWGSGAGPWIVELVSSSMGAVYLQDVSADLGLAPGDAERLLAPIEGRSIETEATNESLIVVSVVTVILMFLAIMVYGQWIAYGVVEEKANRVAELVLGALSPTQLLTAKMISLGGLGFVQLILVGGAGIVTAVALTDLEVPPVTGTVFFWVLLWFLLGYSLYAALYAAAGSLAADTQEAGGMIGPLNIIPGIGYMMGIITFSSGNELVPRVLSLVPVWTPLMMPGRIARGEVSWWEVGLAMALMIISTVIVVRVAARIYLGGITQATRSVGWRQAFRSGGDFGSAPNQDSLRSSGSNGSEHPS